MPPFVAVLVLGAGLYAGARLAGRILSQFAKPDAPGDTDGSSRRHSDAEKDLGRLVVDPASGTYRPATAEEAAAVNAEAGRS